MGFRDLDVEDVEQKTAEGLRHGDVLHLAAVWIARVLLVSLSSRTSPWKSTEVCRRVARFSVREVNHQWPPATELNTSCFGIGGWNLTENGRLLRDQEAQFDQTQSRCFPVLLCVTPID